MTRRVVDAELEVFKPTNSGSTPDTTVVASDIKSFGTRSRLQSLIDRGNAVLKNNNSRYTGDITAGDRVRFLAQLDGQSSLQHIWTGMVRPISYEDLGGNRAEIRLTLDDFVFGVLDIRKAVNSFEQTQIAGTSEAILETILTDEAPEIGQSLIQSVPTDVDVVYNTTSLLDAVRELADRGDAIVGQSDSDLIFKRLSVVPKEFDLQSYERGLPSVRENDDKLVNEQRVEGGVGTNVDDEQTTQTATTRVDSSTRITHQLATRKAEITKVEVYTQTVGSGDNIVIRLQSDDGGAPKDVSSRESDIARKSLSSDFLDSDGFTTFLLPGHSLPDPNPWLIIESDGSTGQDIGTDGSGNPTYKAHYPFPVASVGIDQASIDEYRRREGVLREDTIKTFEEAEQVAFSALRHSKEPVREVSFPAESNRVHNLSIGEVIGVELPEHNFGASGSPQDAIVIEKVDNYDGTKLTTDITAQDVDTV